MRSERDQNSQLIGRKTMTGKARARGRRGGGREVRGRLPGRSSRRRAARVKLERPCRPQDSRRRRAGPGDGKKRDLCWSPGERLGECKTQNHDMHQETSITERRWHEQDAKEFEIRRRGNKGNRNERRTTAKLRRMLGDEANNGEERTS